MFFISCIGRFLLLCFISSKYLKHMSISENFYAPNFFFFVRFNFWFFKFFTIFWIFWAKKACFSPNFFFLTKTDIYKEADIILKTMIYHTYVFKVCKWSKDEVQKGVFFCLRSKFLEKMLAVDCPLMRFFPKGEPKVTGTIFLFKMVEMLNHKHISLKNYKYLF